MNLFQKHPEDYKNDLDSYPLTDEQGVSISSSYHRIRAWKQFFNEEAQNFNFDTEYILSVFNEIEDNEILCSQTAYELELSFNFFRKLFTKSGGISIKSKVVAHKLIAFSLIHSKYYGLAVFSVSKAIDELSCFPAPLEIHKLFEKVFVKYQYPDFFIENIEYLNNDELHILMSALSGKNMKNHPIFLAKLTSHDFTNVMAFSLPNVYTSRFFERASSFVLMRKVTHNSSEIGRFILYSKIYRRDPCLFFEKIEFWQRAYKLAEPSILLHQIDPVYFVDYFDHIATVDNPMASIVKRTPKSLLRQVNDWHREVYLDDLGDLKFLIWDDGENLPDLEFNDEFFFYQCKLLKSGSEVYDEGLFQKHCVSTYIMACAEGTCRIWSLRKSKNQVYVPWITIEEIHGTIVQAKLKNNETPSQNDFKVIEIWANQMGFTVGEFLYSE